MKSLRFSFTIDVDWIPGSESGLVGLYAFCERFGLEATLFIAGRFAEDYPGHIREAARRGHELGTHGWAHGLDTRENFLFTPPEKQKRWIELSTAAVERASGVRPVAFRAPNLWVGESTFQALEESGYRLDSSVPAGRLGLGYGRVNSLRYFRAPLRPYHPSPTDLGIRGDSPIIEIAPSASFIPINMAALRVMGLGVMKWAVRRIARKTPYLVFYSHPSEFVAPEHLTLPSGEPVRHTRGTGPGNFILLGQFIDYVRSLGYTTTGLSGLIHENGDRNNGF